MSEAVSPDSPLPALETQTSIITEATPSIDTLQQLAELSHKLHTELGIQTYMDQNGQTTSTYIKGSQHVIATNLVPSPPPGIDKCVFFHTHPSDQDESLKWWASFPSEGLFQSDLWDHVDNIDKGGGLNILTTHGVTLYLGSDNQPRQEQVTRETHLRLPHGTKRATEGMWKILSGQQKGQSLANRDEIITENRPQPNEPYLILSRTELDGLVHYFIFLSWEHLKELHSEFESFDNLCFGTGLKTLLSNFPEFQYHPIPIHDNLSDAIKHIPKPSLIRKPPAQIISPVTGKTTVAGAEVK